MLLKASEARLIADNHVPVKTYHLNKSVEQEIFEAAREGHREVLVRYEISTVMQDTLRKLGYAITVNCGMDFVIKETTISWANPRMDVFGKLNGN